jgi:hypothetical protein
MKVNEPKQKRSSAIVAMVIVSESELAKVIPDYDYRLEQEQKFEEILYALGADVSKPYLRQDGLQHRNRFNEVVVCSRWLAYERQDSAWVESGYASKEAIDKAAGSKILDDLYRTRYLTEDGQALLEARDRGSNRGNSKREAS